MKRLHIMHVIDSFGVGGAEGGVRKLLSGLDSFAFEQTVCTVAPSRQSDVKDARVVSLDCSNQGQKMLVGRLRRVFSTEHPDIVHSRNWGAIEAVVAARMARIRTVIHSEHGLEWSTGILQTWRRTVARRI